jgi:hypothetical protein
MFDEKPNVENISNFSFELTVLLSCSKILNRTVRKSAFGHTVQYMVQCVPLLHPINLVTENHF